MRRARTGGEKIGRPARRRVSLLVALAVAGILGSSACSVRVGTTRDVVSTPRPSIAPRSTILTTTSSVASADSTSSTTRRDSPSTGSTFRVVDRHDLCTVVPRVAIEQAVGRSITGTRPYTGIIGYSTIDTQQLGCEFTLEGGNELSFAVVVAPDMKPLDSAGFEKIRERQQKSADRIYQPEKPYEVVDSLGVPAFFEATSLERSRLYLDTGVQVLSVAGGTSSTALDRPRIVAAAHELLAALR